MTDHNAYARYLLALRKTPLDDKTEHTDRGALESLLQAVAESYNPGTKVQNEPKRVAAKGAPDFKVSRKGLILGYVENKPIGENLDKFESPRRSKITRASRRISSSRTICISSGSARTVSSARRCAMKRMSRIASSSFAKIASSRSTSFCKASFRPLRRALADRSS